MLGGLFATSDIILVAGREILCQSEAQRRSECDSNYDLVCAGIALSSYTIVANKDVQEIFENKVSKLFYELRTWMMSQTTMDVSEAITLCFSEVSLYFLS